MVSCQPRASSPWPKILTNFSVKYWTNTPAVKAPMKRIEEMEVRSTEFGVITPISAVYGMFTAVYRNISKLYVT